MKQRILVVALTAAVLGMTGCSSTPSFNSNSGGQAISDQRVATSEFKRQGVKVIYSLTGDVEAIEVTGYAAVWGNSQNAIRESYRVAELEAKKSLNDFINKETITSSVSVKMISQNLEHANDQKTNKFSSNKSDSDELVAVDVGTPAVDSKNGQNNQDENTATRNDALRIASRVSTTITTENRGILGGLYLVEGSVINDGKNVQAVYRWDKKHNASRLQVRNMMSM